MTDLKIIEYGDLVTIDKNKLEIALKSESGLDVLIKSAREKIEAEKAKLGGDMSKVGNRAKLRKLAAFVLGGKKGSLRKWIDDNSGALLAVKKKEIAAQQAGIKLITGARKSAFDACKKLHTETIAPAVEWEEKEKEHEAELEAEIQKIIDAGNMTGGSLNLVPVLETLEATPPLKKYYGKLFEKAEPEWKAAVDKLKKSIELEELKEAESARKSEEEKARIKKEAEEKADKKLEADRIAAKAEKQRSEEDRERMFKERVREIRRLGEGIVESSSDGIKYRLELLHKTKLTEDNFGSFLEEARTAYNDTQSELNLAFKKSLEREKREAQEKKRKDKEQQKKEAVATLERERDKKRKEEESRQADADHKQKIEDEIFADMVKLNFAKSDALRIINQIDKIRNLFIQY